MQKLNVTDRFAGVAHWAGLSEEDKATIGAAALEWMAAEAVQDRGYQEGGDLMICRERVGMAAGDACRNAIQEIFVDAVPREALEGADGAPRIPTLLGMVCECCGCSENDACPEGCSWARDDLCTACTKEGRDDA